MDNSTKKTIMLGALLLGCALTSLLGNLLGNDKISIIGSKEQFLIKDNKGSVYNTNSTHQNSEELRKTIKVYVSGAVQRPGIYDLPLNARADDAVKIAGDMLESADTQKVNLALKLKDGMQVNVPFVKSYRNYNSHEQNSLYREKNNNYKTDVNDSLMQNKNFNNVINLNSASLNELESLPGIGPSMAQKIVDYRQQNRFYRIEDLLKVPGIGKAKLARLKGRISV